MKLHDHRTQLATNELEVIPAGYCVLPGEMTWIEVDRRPSYPAWVVADETGTPVAKLTAWLEVRFESDWVVVGLPIEPISMDPSTGLVALGGLPFRGYGDSQHLRIGLSAPGFAVAHVVDPLAKLSPEGEALVVHMRLEEDGWLRVVDQDGAAYGRAIQVMEGVRGRRLFNGIPGADGLVGPLPRSEEEWIVSAASSSRVAPRDGKVIEPWRRIQENIPTVVIDASCRITVPLPAGFRSELQCRESAGTMYSGTRVGNELLFDHLPPGRYEVGPSVLHATASLRRYHKVAINEVELSSGQHALVPFQESWIAPESMSGRISAVGIDYADLFVAPLYEPVGAPIMGGRAHERTPVSGTGEWLLRDLEMVPSAIMVGYLDYRGEEVPLAVGPSLEFCEVACAEVEIRQANPEESIYVEYASCLQPPWRAAAKVRHWGQVNSDGSFNLERVPVNASLTVMVGDLEKQLSLNLRPGERNPVSLR